jgi:hypothetical protein
MVPLCKKLLEALPGNAHQVCASRATSTNDISLQPGAEQTAGVPMRYPSGRPAFIDLKLGGPQLERPL